LNNGEVQKTTEKLKSHKHFKRKMVSLLKPSQLKCNK